MTPSAIAAENKAANEASEFDRAPVTSNQLLPARHFAASYSGEHVAGTEFVIGASFVAWGVSTGSVIGGLLLGNLLAVLSWVLLCAPVARDTRLTLYAYLEKIAGPGIIRLYSVINGIFFCVLGGAMITVSASAVRILFGIESQVNWYPTSAAFIVVALCVGAVVVAVAVRGFSFVARFAEVCAPWMILMFAVGAIALWPTLSAEAGVATSSGFWGAFVAVGDAYIWVENTESELTFWHVAAFAWVCNVPLHVGMSDMTVLRFARRSRYAWFSALGMYIGHFGAWVCAGVMGAGAALLLKTGVQTLDAGEVAYQALGAAGIVAVIIAGWTTSNPTIYRAGLAFQSLNPTWDRTRVTIVTGVLTTIVACFPFVFTKLMDFLGLMGLLIAPIGAVIITEHWVFPKLGLTRYWSTYQGRFTNSSALVAWGAALLVAWFLHQLGVHLFFLLVPAWLTAMVVYTLAARSQGAAESYEQTAKELADVKARRAREATALATVHDSDQVLDVSAPARLARIISYLCLAICAGMAVAVLGGSELDWLRSWLIAPSLVYLLSATYWINAKERLS